MRKAALVASLLVLSGCSGFDKWLTDTATLPGANPNLPGGESETLRRVKGYAASETPILPESGNIWPGAPRPLPSLSDVASDHDTILGSSKSDLPDGGKLAIGEDVDDSFSGAGAKAALPSVEPDVAEKYGAGKMNTSTIEIPNGDGTTTLIHPDGSISTVRSSTLHHATAPAKNAKAVGAKSLPSADAHDSKAVIVPVTPLLAQPAGQ
ncbi:hypothetical protein [Acetobacter conturbans]|uniref:DUF3035 domain-containing protein n=1 Tax=Acetobacter conturbans TaxID=1737472 RepID=A0ABX0JV23_9PROT|nr:hypothetical protein [Acetobacter conturbans]NHN87353.1 hypothetical protein [Acetobacter conturbans]